MTVDRRRGDDMVVDRSEDTTEGTEIKKLGEGTDEQDQSAIQDIQDHEAPPSYWDSDCAITGF
jgi:hypothetical protein